MIRIRQKSVLIRVRRVIRGLLKRFFQGLFELSRRLEENLRLIDERLVDHRRQLFWNGRIAFADRHGFGLQYDLPGVFAAREVACADPASK